MKRLLMVSLAGTLAGTLAACQPEPAAEPVVEEAAEAAPVTVANGTPVGTFAVTNADGTAGTTVINADGTYTDTDSEGNLVAEGTWAVVEGKTCFTPTTEGQTAMCYTESAPAEDGSFTATPDEGDPVTVRPAAAAQ
ncbi:MAG: hypothetical protein APF82_07225 [Sphingomonadales bacterium BRH_c42]|nr:MAG: hypothetical protein APF82_07225 [Sphingomonadales bacterium BRH_c42]